MKIRAVLFDKDGTLVDVDRTWGPAVYAVMGRLAAGDRARLEALMACCHYREDERRFAATSPVLAGSPADYADDWAMALGEVPSPAFRARLAGMLAEEGLRHLTPIGAPRDVFAELARRRVPLGIATNHGETAARDQARALGLDGYLGFVAGYDSGFGGKPGPGMIQAFARAVGLPTSEIAMVGDSFHDLHAARAAGAVAVAVPTGLIAAGALAAQADIVISALSDLVGLIRGG